ncbi:MAG: hypothetical protein AseanaTS_03710 [Candidatus Pelagadaptatus aseana]|uniref:hypothetical protein n=1 Tax=Candidatus Pelagadaptatus aseana TaxID=3120508 RepID=UPI0039B35D99
MDKNIKTLASAAIIFFLSFVPLFFILEGYIAGEVQEFGRRNHDSHHRDNELTNYWYNMMAWIVGYVFCLGYSIKEFVTFFRQIGKDNL